MHLKELQQLVETMYSAKDRKPFSILVSGLDELARFGQRPGTKECETELLSERDYSCFPLSDELVESSLFDEVAA